MDSLVNFHLDHSFVGTCALAVLAVGQEDDVRRNHNEANEKDFVNDRVAILWDLPVVSIDEELINVVPFAMRWSLVESSTDGMCQVFWVKITHVDLPVDGKGWVHVDVLCVGHLLVLSE